MEERIKTRLDEILIELKEELSKRIEDGAKITLKFHNGKESTESIDYNSSTELRVLSFYDFKPE